MKNRITLSKQQKKVVVPQCFSRSKTLHMSTNRSPIWEGVVSYHYPIRFRAKKPLVRPRFIPLFVYSRGYPGLFDKYLHFLYCQGRTHASHYIIIRISTLYFENCILNRSGMS